MIFNNKRSESEIIFDLLSSAKQDIKKTRLMYKTNMTYVQFVKYLDFLLEKDLLEGRNINEREQVYNITDKGKELIESLDTVLNYLK